MEHFQKLLVLAPSVFVVKQELLRPGTRFPELSKLVCHNAEYVRHVG